MGYSRLSSYRKARLSLGYALCYAATMTSPAKHPAYTTETTQPENAKSMRFMPRDGKILQALHAYDGVLAEYQIKELFFTGWSQARLRLRFLHQHGYIARPTFKKRLSLNHLVYWLDKQGAAYVAGLSGKPLRDFHYVREPRWSQLDHDLAVNDVFITITKACFLHPAFTLVDWIPQSEFYSYPDRVEYTDPHGKTVRRLIRPDAYIFLKENDQPFRFLLEVDMATESNARFAREKVVPGLAYLKSKVYSHRFGHNSGRFLIVTTTDRKRANMQRQTELAAGKDARLFCFTTLDQLKAHDILTDPIWYQGGEEQPSALFKTTS